jgi:hypothetical protein
MNWIKQNTFLAGFFGVMIVGIGALGFLLFSAMSKADEATASYTDVSGKLTRLQNLSLSPTEKNLKALVAQKQEAVEAIKAFQATVAKMTFPTEEMSPEQFQDKLKAVRNGIVEKAAGVPILPEKTFLGFEMYEGQPPAKDAATPLGHELKAVEWIFQQLIESRATEVKDIKRALLPEETKAGAAPERGGNRPGPGQGRASKGLMSSHQYDMTVICEQKALGAFLNTLLGAKAPQFYLLRSIVVKNQVPTGPPRAGAVVAGAPAPGPGPEKPVSSYIAGTELLEVNLQIEIVDFAEPTASPSK